MVELALLTYMLRPGSGVRVLLNKRYVRAQRVPGSLTYDRNMNCLLCLFFRIQLSYRIVPRATHAGTPCQFVLFCRPPVLSCTCVVSCAVPQDTVPVPVDVKVPHVPVRVDAEVPQVLTVNAAGSKSKAHQKKRNKDIQYNCLSFKGSG